MSYKVRTRDEHFQNDGSPKRILALDGGGLRGILTLSILAQIEDTLKQRHDDQEQFRLCHYFDLIAGTSTGAIIAAALAQGMTVSEITEKYLKLGHKVFRKSLFRAGLIRALYDHTKLTEELQTVFGESATLGGPTLETGVLIVTKRLDSGSPWPISNNPRGKYYGPRRGSDTIPNAEYPLWQVVRASTAAPRYFEPEHLEIIKAEGKRSVIGEFVDGGVSPFNNPALQAFMYATMDGYRVGWPTGADKILLVSIGTGTRDPAVNPASLAATNAVKSLVSLMDDSASLVETMLQWMSTSPTARSIDRELGDLRHDLVAQSPLLTYLRYNVELSHDYLHGVLELDLPTKAIEPLSSMDDPENMPLLQEIGRIAGRRQVRSEDFPAYFDLRD